MAQYWEDWSGSTVDAEPTGWTKRFVTSGTVYKVEADASGYAPANRRLLIDKSATDRAAISFDAVSSVADVQIRILARCFATAEITTQYAGPAGRIAGAAASETVVAGNFAGKTTTETTQIAQINAGTFSQLKYGASLSWATTGYYWITLTLSSGTATVTIADVATPETVIETISNAVAVTGAGLVGLFASNAAAVVHVLAVGVGTGSDTAPYSDPFSDTTAPTLTSPTASATGQTTADGHVTTDEGNGTLYYIASQNATETAATVKAGSSQSISSTGQKDISITGLTASTSYYLHFCHRDAAGNDSTVSTSAQFTTAAADSTPPTLTGPSASATGSTTADGSVTTNEANGTLYYLATANATETAATVKAGASQAISSIGSKNVGVTGLTASTSYYLHFCHRDAAGNDSTVSTSAQFTTAAADTTVPTMTGSVTFASITQTGYTAQWSAGSDNVAVTGYEYQIGGTGGSWTDAGNNLSVAITGRTSGATETVYVRAYDAAGNRSTPAISGEVTMLAATVTVTDPLKNNAGTLLASQSGVKAAVLQVADLASVYEATGLTTNASGVLSAISNAAITTGSQYHVVIKLADGSVGITGPITAS